MQGPLFGTYETRYANASFSSTTSGSVIVASPGVGKSIWIEQLIVSADEDVDNVEWNLNEGTDLILPSQFMTGKDTWKEHLNLRLTENKTLNLDITKFSTSSMNLTLWLAYRIQG